MSEAINPLLEDDDDEYMSGSNPLLDDDDDYLQPESSASSEREASSTTATAVPVKTRAGATRRERATEKDARILAHLGKFRIAEAESLSLLQAADARPGGRPSGQLMSVRTTVLRLQKLERLRLVESVQLGDERVIWGSTPSGIYIARRHGLLLGEDEASEKGMHGIKKNWVDHYLGISHVAAQFQSPAGFFRNTLKLEPVRLDQLLSESQITRAYDRVNNMLTLEAKAADTPKKMFGAWRAETVREALGEVAAGRIGWNEVLDFYPALWTLGGALGELEKRDFMEHHIPDLVVNLEEKRTSEKRVSFFVEVELSRKSPASMKKVERTYDAEFQQYSGGYAKPIVYRGVVYQYVDSKVRGVVERANKAAELNLIENKKLLLLPILGRDGKMLGLSETL